MTSIHIFKIKLVSLFDELSLNIQREFVLHSSLSFQKLFVVLAIFSFAHVF